MKNNKKNKTIILIIFSIILVILLSSIAYSAFSSTMNITGIAHTRVEANARITDFRLASTNNSTSSYEEFGKNHINSNITLNSSSSTITYYLEITNYGTTDVGIYSITGLPSGVNYQIKDYNLKDKICDTSNKCNSFIKRTYELVISTSSSSFNGDIKIEFNFKPFHNITFKNFSKNYTTDIIDGDSKEIDLSADAPKFIDVDSNYDINYSYSSNILKLNNVASNVEVIKVNELYEYNYTGQSQTFTTPIDGLYKVELWGAQGGNEGGLGGYTSGYINLNEDEKLYVYVGPSGLKSLPENPNLIWCDFNCGTGTAGQPGHDLRFWGTGGGSTDIRLVNGSWNSFNSLKSRIMVAAAGGGVYRSLEEEFLGGTAGGLIGYEGMPEDRFVNSYYGSPGTGGTQTSGGYNIVNNTIDYFYEIGGWGLGKFGHGTFGWGGNSLLGYAYSGGGSGYYGGGSSAHTQSAGGGSSFISGHNGCDAITESSTSSNIIHTGQSIHYSGYKFMDTKMIDGEGYKWTTIKGRYTGMPTFDGTGTKTGNEGAGYAKITLVQTEKTYGISYVEINGEYQNKINAGENLTVNFGGNAPTNIRVLVNNNKISNYSYNNGILTVPNVSGDLEFVGMKSYSYTYTGDYQVFTAPYTGVYKVELWGAQGGYETYDPEYYPGGLGGYTKGNITLNKNQTLYIYVGEKPIDKGLVGGYNGGGNSSWDGSGGGGATDIRLDNSGVNDFNSLKSRIMVAAAGAGGYGPLQNAAGGLTGYSRNQENDGGGGTQTSGGTGGDTIKNTTCINGITPGNPSNGLSENGKFGIGGNAHSSGSGGGGGYYGGGSGIHYCIDNSGGSGGGGSSYISGHNGCDAISESSTEANIVHTGQSIHYSGYQFTDTVVIDGNGYNWTTEKGDYVGIPTHDGTSTTTGHLGNGYAKITLIEID